MVSFTWSAVTCSLLGRGGSGVVVGYLQAEVGVGGMVPWTMRSLDIAERKEAREEEGEKGSEGGGGPPRRSRELAGDSW